MSSDSDPISKIWFIHGLMKKEVEELLRVMEQSKSSIAETNTPPLDVMIRGNSVIITVELPGLGVNDFTVYLYENLLIIEGIRKRYCSGGKIFFIRAEREFAPFKRVMQLPFPVDKDTTQAVLKNGVLTVTLLKLNDNDTGEG
jgi:HSP20 family protein